MQYRARRRTAHRDRNRGAVFGRRLFYVRQREEVMPTYEDDLNQMRAEFEHFSFVVEDAKRGFGEWDVCDPIVWAILRLVTAQSDLAHAITESVCYHGRGRM